MYIYLFNKKNNNKKNKTSLVINVGEKLNTLVYIMLQII